MNAFFSTDERRELLSDIAKSWVGTPFHAHANIRGAGVDCVNLCAAIYILCGTLETFNPPKYSLDGGQHAAHSLITEWVEQSGRFAPVLPYQQKLRAQLQPGDLLCFKVGRVAWHVGVMVGESRFVHALHGVGVSKSSIDESVWARRLIAAWRPLEVAS